MAGTRVKISAVLVAAGAVVAAAAVTAVLLLGSDSGAPEPETGPVPSNAPAPDTSVVAESDDAPSSQTLIATDDGAPTGSSASTVEDAAASSGDGTTGPSGQQSDPEPAEKPVEIAASDSEPEFALEIVEPLELDFEVVGGARQEPPVVPAGADGSGGSGGFSSAWGDVYTWQDGDRTLGARLQVDLVVLEDGTILSRDEVATDSGNGGRTTRSVGGEQSSSSSPVFRSESGELMTLPGGILVVLVPEWDTDATAAFFARNGIAGSRVSALDYLTNWFFVETDPGFASLDLANALAGKAGVEISSPNWWQQYTTE